MPSRVVLGLGGGLDSELELSAPVLESLVEQYRIRRAELTSPATVTGERDLVVSILSYIRQGGGGEHFVSASEALRAFAARFPGRLALGGTAVRAAVAMSRLGVPSTLHLVTLNDVIRRLLPADCDYLSSGREDTCFPHLIVQYDRALRVRAGDIDIQVPFSNRLIYVNDPANESMVISDELGSLLRHADVFLISGLNAVRDEGVLDERLADVRRHLTELPPGAVVYYEDAAFHERAFSGRVRDALLEVTDVYGLNEDEMQSYLGASVDLLSAAEVEQALTALHALIPAPTLVVHTRYWAAALGRHAAEYADPLTQAILVAGARYSHGDDYTQDHYQDMRTRPRRAAAGQLAAALHHRMGEAVRCVPALDLEVARPTTIGLGDTFVGGFLAAIARRKAS